MSHTLILTNTTYPDTEFEKQINNFGFDIVHIPTLSISYNDVKIDSSLVFDTLVITSKHAVYNIDKYDIPMGINILCVGETIKEILLKCGFTNIKHCFENGTELVCHIQESNSYYTNIIYLRGKDVQHDIKSVCLERGMLLKEYIVYESNKVVESADNIKNIINKNHDVTVCLFSNKGVNCLVDNIRLFRLEDVAKRTNILCLSESMLISLKKFKWNKILCCTSPTRAGFLEQLKLIKEDEN